MYFYGVEYLFVKSAVMIFIILWKEFKFVIKICFSGQIHIKWSCQPLTIDQQMISSSSKKENTQLHWLKFSNTPFISFTVHILFIEHVYALVVWYPVWFLISVRLLLTYAVVLSYNAHLPPVGTKFVYKNICVYVLC